jgi:uncharacterized protein YqcC (DUF446 family)
MPEEMLSQKIEEVISELKRMKLWKKSAPEWVGRFSSQPPMEESDFAAWLQFVYLPNLRQHGHRSDGLQQSFVAPQAVKCLPSCASNPHLLTLFVELDSLA